MATTFTGGSDARIQRLEARGRRCIALNGRCVNAAVDLFDVIPMLHGLPHWGAPIETRKTCGRHRLAVIADKRIHVLKHLPGALKESDAA